MWGLADPVFQRVGDTVGGDKKIAEPYGCRKEERSTCLHGFYCMRFFRNNKVAYCAVLKRSDFDG